jgi:hypothetical protein
MRPASHTAAVPASSGRGASTFIPVRPLDPDFDEPFFFRARPARRPAAPGSDTPADSAR